MNELLFLGQACFPGSVWILRRRGEIFASERLVVAPIYKINMCTDIQGNFVGAGTHPKPLVS